MKRFTILLVVSVSIFLGLSTVQAVRAQEAMSEAQLDKIRQNCVTVQGSLHQLHASDALMRVNRGQLYELISTKLMAPLNSRIALNRLSGLDMASTTLEYDKELSSFRASYKVYEESMSRTMKTDCVSKPAEFYENLVLTRERRQVVHEDTRSLSNLLEQYKAEFEAFAKEFEGTRP